LDTPLSPPLRRFLNQQIKSGRLHNAGDVINKVEGE
jgi:hypothetical protein